MTSVVGVVAGVLMLSSGPTRAWAAPTVPARQLSGYEQESIRAALAELGGAERELSPDGKRIESIQVVTLDVIEPRDPAPGFLNWVHSTTRQAVVRREVLLAPGQPYAQDLADETERNLRSKAQLSVVLVVPLKGTQPSTVKVLVITKDVWSLRIANQPTFEGAKLTSLAIQPSETNLFGTHHVLAGSVLLTADNYWLGATYTYPRIGGSWVSASVTASAAFRCGTGEVEGASGSFWYGQPLYSTRAPWSWQVIARWSSVIGRVVSNARLRTVRSVCSGGEPEKSSFSLGQSEIMEEAGERFVTDRVVSVPGEYQSVSLSGQFGLTRSFFLRNKLNLSTGIQLTRNRLHWLDVDPAESEHESRRVVVDTNDQVVSVSTEPSPFSATDLSAVLASRAPSGRRRISPYLQLHAYSNRWLITSNYNTLGLQETWPMGHDVYVRFYPSFHPVSSHDVLATFASASYSWPVDSGFFRVFGSAQLETGFLREGFEQDPGALNSDDSVSRPEVPVSVTADADYRLGVHFASPDIGVGRLVVDVSARYRPVRTFSGALGTGGTDRLRGYDRVEFVDNGVVNSNVELRTRPLQLFSILGGLALFYDAGGAFDYGDSQPSNKKGRQFNFDGGHSLGLGLRVLSPQLDRDVFRVDFAFPLEKRAVPFGFIAQFNHAFSAPVPFVPGLLRE